MDEGFIVYEKNESLIEEDSFSFLLSEIIKHSDNQSDRNTNSLEYKKQKIETNKELFLLLIKQLHTLVGNTLSTQIPNKLDDKRKKEYEQCQQDWNTTIGCIDFLERQIKETTNSLLEAFHADENGELHNDCAMINCTGFEDVSGCEERFVPVVLPDHLFSLLNSFCFFSFCMMYAKNVQCDVDSLFENDPKKRDESIKKLLEPYVSYIKHQLEDIKNGQEKNRNLSIAQSDKLSREHEKQMNEIKKRNRADKRKPLTQEECADVLFKKKVKYCKTRENYLRKVGITATKVKPPKESTMVLRTIQRWDQYLATDGEKGSKPPKGYSREKSTKEFEEWAEEVEMQKYLRWEKKQPSILSRKKAIEEDEENIEEKEEDFKTRSKQSLDDYVNRFSRNN